MSWRKKNTHKEQEKEKRLRKNGEGLREMQDNMKCNNIRIIGIPVGEEEEQGIENLFEKVMMENFPNLMREKVIQIQETQRVPSKRSPKRPTARHIIIKMAKFQDKERILKAAREKQEVTYKGAPIRLATDFSMETLQARRERQKIFQVMRTRGLQPRLLYPARLSIKIQDEIKSFPDKRSLKEYTSTKPALQEMLNGCFKERKEKRKREQHRYEKMAMNNDLSIITLNVNGLNDPIKRHRVAE